MNTSEKRLSKLTLFAYGMGDFASNLCWTFIGSYLSVFYTDVVGMAPAIASAIMLIAKIWDGVNDPMFGAIAERTNTKRGRFRPYILFGAPILAVLSVLAFTTIGRGNAAVIYAAITYIGCGMAYTVVNLSYGSLSTVMTTNPEDIAQLNSWRMMGTNLSSVLLNAITAPLLMKFFGRMGVVIYYLMYNVQRYDLIAAFMSLPSLFTVIGIFLTKNYIVKIGKKKMAAIGYIGAAISLILIFIIGKTAGYTNIPLLLGLHCAYGFFCFSFPIPMAMVPDAINYQEDRTGVRSDGISYATVSLSTKFGSAFGVSGALLIMGATGYIANAQQTAAALNGINVTVNLIFGIMYLCCLIPLAMYPLNEKKSGEIIENLQKKRAQRDEK